MPADKPPAWTIKNIAPEDRNAAIAAAGREQMTIGEWLSRAIRAQVQADRRQDRSPALAQPALQPDVFAALERILPLASQIQESPDPIRRDAMSLLRRQLRALRQAAR